MKKNFWFIMMTSLFVHMVFTFQRELDSYMLAKYKQERTADVVVVFIIIIIIIL